ncbi:MAG: response regulator transcription factor [Anaerolineales bacterium]|nr:response regulator transcription factor [Anaerolineales bacterium]
MKNKGTFPNRILITEDHSIIRRTLRDWLGEEYPGLRVTEASNGEDALKILETRPLPELVLMDFHLPGRSGIDISQEIKAKHPELPVVILTIQEDDQYQAKAFEAGIDGYVVKRKMYTDLIPTISALFNSETEEGVM